MTDSSARPSIVFVVAHPDDVAFGMGGTATLLKNHYDLHIICASKGERGYKFDGEGMTPPSSDIAQLREKEELEAAAILGAKVTFLGLIDGEIYAGKEVCYRVAEMLKTLKPKAVFTLSPTEKSDHAAACLIAREALYLAKLYWETEIYMTVRPGETHNPLNADIFVNIDPVLDQKKELIACHKTQLPEADSWKRKIGRDKVMGSLANCNCAEAYMSEMPLITSRWDRKAGSVLMDLPIG